MSIKSADPQHKMSLMLNFFFFFFFQLITICFVALSLFHRVDKIQNSPESKPGPLAPTSALPLSYDKLLTQYIKKIISC